MTAHEALTLAHDLLARIADGAPVGCLPDDFDSTFDAVAEAVEGIVP